MTSEQIRRAKRWLAQNGYDIGRIDGAAGSRFVEAFNQALGTGAFRGFLQASRMPTQPLADPAGVHRPSVGGVASTTAAPGKGKGSDTYLPGSGYGTPAPPDDPDVYLPGDAYGPPNLPPGTSPPGTKPPKEEKPEDEDKEEKPVFNNDLMAQIESLLDQFGLATPGILEFARNAIIQGWSFTQIQQELRRQPDYLANPLFAANIERAKSGKGFMPEGQVLAYAAEAKRLARQYGYSEPSDNYIADGFRANKSLAEIEHLIQIQRRIDEFGPGVRMVAEQELGVDLSDDDLFEIFDDERDTRDFDRAMRNAEYRGRPMILGLGIRSQAEADALAMMGVDPDEAFSRWEGVRANTDRFARLTAIEGQITGNLPADFGSFLSGVDNGLLSRALVFQDPRALAELQAMTSREIARFNQGGGAAMANSGAAVGLLTPDQR